MADASPLRNSPALTGLRGFAAAIVVTGHLAHEGLFFRLFDGWQLLGVWLFFILSAYLMTRRYLHQDPHEALGGYVRARIGRVFPLYYAVLIVSLPLAGYAFWRYKIEGLYIPLSFLMAAAPQELWAVPVEVQFYACFAGFWLMWWKDRRGALWLAGAALVVGVVITLARYLAHVDPTGLNAYLYIFMLGAACAMNEARLLALVERFGRFVALLAIALLTLTIARPFAFPTRADPIAISAALSIFVLTLRGGGFMAWRPVVLLGEVSYGFYLLHHVVLTAGVYLFGTTPLLAVPVVAVTFALAWLSLRYFEVPARRFIQRREVVA